MNLSNERYPSCLVYTGDYTAQLYGDDFINHKRILSLNNGFNEPGFLGTKDMIENMQKELRKAADKKVLENPSYSITLSVVASEPGSDLAIARPKIKSLGRYVLIGLVPLWIFPRVQILEHKIESLHFTFYTCYR